VTGCRFGGDREELQKALTPAREHARVSSTKLFRRKVISSGVQKQGISSRSALRKKHQGDRFGC
jgi:hypothetical protein